ncbi:hypothetical protein BD777DRAFT_164326 [Yarrowia lipolytica]|nr:hypothetical protein BD777DRAFT_164326 [Yarrowia lipolytica]
MCLVLFLPSPQTPLIVLDYGEFGPQYVRMFHFVVDRQVSDIAIPNPDKSLLVYHEQQVFITFMLGSDRLSLRQARCMSKEWLCKVDGGDVPYTLLVDQPPLFLCFDSSGSWRYLLYAFLSTFAKVEACLQGLVPAQCSVPVSKYRLLGVSQQKKSPMGNYGG